MVKEEYNVSEVRLKEIKEELGRLDYAAIANRMNQVNTRRPAEHYTPEIAREMAINYVTIMETLTRERFTEFEAVPFVLEGLVDGTLRKIIRERFSKESKTP